ncbi:MAG: trimethylamine methyltransferase family protein [Anaerolineales bacterium]|nr:trimethylamine methyltransferase family protein [Anaerolineales bacterium]
MKTHPFEVLSPDEVQQIHAASMEVLSTVGVKVDYAVARKIFARAGAEVDEETLSVRLPGALVMDAISAAPKTFHLHGADGKFSVEIGGGEPVFAALGTPTAILDLETGEHRPTGLQDLIHHIQLIDSCQQIHCSQMDVWPNDVPMTTIHSEAIYAWATNSRKPFGLGCYGYRPTLDMMEMMAIASGGKAELQARPRFFGICSTVSPLQMTQIQLEGMLICAEYGQPVTMAPEGIAGTTAPVTLAGLLVQENANILAHIVLAQLFRPGTPVLYGTVSTIANMRTGTVALGAVETGLITAGSVQLAKFYGLPCRSVGSATDAKREDYQAGFERFATLLPAVLGGVDYITCAGTLDSSMLESDALLVLDDEICAAALRVARGIEVNEMTLAMDIIRKVNFSGNFITEKHTMQNFRQEHFIPQLLVREPYEAWEKAGAKSALERARERARQLLADHQPAVLDPSIAKELEAYRKMVAARPVEDFYKYEAAELQGLFLDR